MSQLNKTHLPDYNLLDYDLPDYDLPDYNCRALAGSKVVDGATVKISPEGLQVIGSNSAVSTKADRTNSSAIFGQGLDPDAGKKGVELLERYKREIASFGCK